MAHNQVSESTAEKPSESPSIGVTQTGHPPTLREVEAEGKAQGLSMANKIGRLFWGVVWILAFRPSPRKLYFWRRWLLRMFGAQIGSGVVIYPSTRIFAPWKLRMDDHACAGPDVDLYSVDLIHIGEKATVSQYAYLCSASHDYEDPRMPLTHAPIRIEPNAWVCADAFVGPGVRIGCGAVVGACAVVMRDVEDWNVVAGNPAKFIKMRVMRNIRDET